MPASVICSRCLGSGKVCFHCGLPSGPYLEFGKRCRCMQFDGHILVGGMVRNMEPQIEPRIDHGEITIENCSLCHGTGKESLRLDEARGFLKRTDR